MLRIITGKFKGRKIQTPEGLNTRPVTDRIRTKVFDLLTGQVADAVVADVYAGSGVYGLEALSRGARKCVFYENSTAAIDCIRQNISNCKVTEGTLIIRKSLPQSVNSADLGSFLVSGETFDLVFCDPPFVNFDKESLQKIIINPVFQKALICLRIPATEVLPDFTNTEIVYSEKVGVSGLYFLKSLV